jgi:hypothetical protein
MWRHSLPPQVVEAMKAQGLLPNMRTIYLMLEESAKRGDVEVAEQALQLARAQALDVDSR